MESVGNGLNPDEHDRPRCHKILFLRVRECILSLDEQPEAGIVANIGTGLMGLKAD